MFEKEIRDYLSYSDCCAMHNYILRRHLGFRRASSRYVFDDNQLYLEF